MQWLWWFEFGVVYECARTIRCMQLCNAKEGEEDDDDGLIIVKGNDTRTSHIIIIFFFP